MNEYHDQDEQLNKMHKVLIVLKYGYNSLRQQLSGAECSVSELLQLSRDIGDGLDDLNQPLETKLNDIETCISEACTTLDTIEEVIHPCGEGDWGNPVVSLDFSEHGDDDCPWNWVEVTKDGRRFCGGSSVGGGSVVPFCDAALFAVNKPYRRVCGKIVGYGYGDNEAFSAGGTIDDPYVDGLSLTHGVTGSRVHIWSFAIGIAEIFPGIFPGTPSHICPCNSVLSGGGVTPLFVGEDYFCESGTFVFPGSATCHLDDPLWDGEDCGYFCCNNSPFFIRTLGSTTNSPLEIRLCNNANAGANNLVEKIKIYVE